MSPPERSVLRATPERFTPGWTSRRRSPWVNVGEVCRNGSNALLAAWIPVSMLRVLAVAARSVRFFWSPAITIVRRSRCRAAGCADLDSAGGVGAGGFWTTVCASNMPITRFTVPSRFALACRPRRAYITARISKRYPRRSPAVRASPSGTSKEEVAHVPKGGTGQAFQPRAVGQPHAGHHPERVDRADRAARPHPGRPGVGDIRPHRRARERGRDPHQGGRDLRDRVTGRRDHHRRARERERRREGRAGSGPRLPGRGRAGDQADRDAARRPARKPGPLDPAHPAQS